MTFYFIEPTTRKFVKGYGSNKYRKQLLDTASNAGLDGLNAPFKKVVHKAAEATGEVIGKKIAEKIVKPKPIIHENSTNIEKIVVPS